MSGNELFLAFMLLTTPPGLVESPPSETNWPALREAIQKTAIEWEILDPRENAYLLAKRAEFSIDINILRRRYCEYKEAPRIAECQRLPERTTVNELIQFNRGYRKHLSEKLSLDRDRSEQYDVALHETDRLYKVWDSVRDARCDFYYVTVRRAALKKLKESIGEEAFTLGQLPPNVPTWRFNEVR
jgi:hypothetical protein